MQRDLPDSYTAGDWVNVKLIAQPGTNVNAWAVEEQPPSGWQFGQASDDGTFDKTTGKKTGLSRRHRADASLHDLRADQFERIEIFTGSVRANGVSKTIFGDITITDVLRHHPAVTLAPRFHHRGRTNRLCRRVENENALAARDCHDPD